VLGEHELPQVLDQVEDEAAEVVSLLRMMATPDGLAEAVDTAISRVVSQQRKTSRSTRRKVLDHQLKRLAELARHRGAGLPG